jgi:hypothetical protein
MTIHAVRCKRTGEIIAIQLDGGMCVCRSENECRLITEVETYKDAVRGAVRGLAARILGERHLR